MTDAIRQRVDAAAIRIRCTITREAHPALYDALLKVKGRRRLERLRTLAQLGAMVEAGSLRLVPGDSVEPVASMQEKSRSTTVPGKSAPARIGDDFLGFNL